MSLPIFRDHPRGLLTCFSIELWERFSYYGMRALLIFFLTEHFLFSDRQGYLIYGAYTALVYMMAIFGGALADRYLGARKAITLGALLLVLGHFGLVIEGPPAKSTMVAGVETVVRDAVYLGLFYLSLAAIVTGVGLMKTSTTTMVGALYALDDPRRDAGFTIYYMGINIGGAAAPLLCGWIGHTYGWRYGFGLAGLGMLIGLVAFRHGQRHLLGLAEPPAEARLAERVLGGLTREWLIYACVIAVVFVVWIVIRHQEAVGVLLGATGLVVAAFLLYDAFARCTPVERDRLFACVALIVFTIGFWAFYEQMGSSLNVFAERVVDRSVMGHEIPASMLQALPAVFVILLAPLFSAAWLTLGKRGREPSTPIKFCLAIFQLALAFLLLAVGTRLTPDGSKVALGWFILNFLLLVTGELCLAPVGQSMVTRLAPRQIVGMMMGCFLLAYSAASFISGLIAQLTAVTGPAGAGAALTAELGHYASVYSRLGLLAMGVVLLLLAFTPLLKRLSHEHPRMTYGD
jgi:POT family proton-dependent oligopeptide transporter